LKRNISKPELINFPRFLDERGNLSFLEGGVHIPFKVQRTYWIYDVPGGEKRTGRALKDTSEVIIALSGSFDVVLHDGSDVRRFALSRSYYGLYVPKNTWRELENFSTNSLTLVVADRLFSQNEYIREFDTFLKSIQ